MAHVAVAYTVRPYAVIVYEVMACAGMGHTVIMHNYGLYSYGLYSYGWSSADRLERPLPTNCAGLRGACILVIRWDTFEPFGRCQKQKWRRQLGASCRWLKIGV